MPCSVRGPPGLSIIRPIHTTLLLFNTLTLIGAIMPTILDFNTDEVPDLELVPEGEYKLEIIKAEVKNSRKGEPMLSSMHKIVGKPNAQLVFSNIMLPTEELDEEDRNSRLRRLKAFKAAHGITATKFDPESLKGRTGYALLSEEETAEHGKQNKISRWIDGK
jgi:hypothetical protein